MGRVRVSVRFGRLVHLDSSHSLYGLGVRVRVGLVRVNALGQQPLAVMSVWVRVRVDWGCG